MVYTSSTLSLAAWETVVNTESLSVLQYIAYNYCSFDIKPAFIDDLSKKELNDIATKPSKAKDIGSQWILNGTKPVLRVPSFVFPEESNYLINPRNKDFSKLDTKKAKNFSFDERFHELIEDI